MVRSSSAERYTASCASYSPEASLAVTEVSISAGTAVPVGFVVPDEALQFLEDGVAPETRTGSAKPEEADGFSADAVEAKAQPASRHRAERTVAVSLIVFFIILLLLVLIPKVQFRGFRFCSGEHP